MLRTKSAVAFFMVLGLLVSCFAVLPAAAENPNLIQNGDFSETDGANWFTGWSRDNFDLAKLSDTSAEGQAHSGQYAVNLNRPDKAYTGVSRAMSQQLEGLEDGASYTLKYWYYQNQDLEENTSVYFGLSDGNNLNNRLVNDHNWKRDAVNTWVEQTFQFTYDDAQFPNGCYLTVFIKAYDGYIDDISLTKDGGEEPAEPEPESDKFNFVPNGTFESALGEKWTGYNGDYVNVSADDKYGGEQSLHISLREGTANKVGLIEGISVRPHTDMTLTYWTKLINTASGSWSRLVVWQDAIGTDYDKYAPAESEYAIAYNEPIGKNAGDGWVKQSIGFNTGDNEKIRIGLTCKNMEYYIDNMELTYDEDAFAEIKMTESVFENGGFVDKELAKTDAGLTKGATVKFQYLFSNNLKAAWEKGSCIVAAALYYKENGVDKMDMIDAAMLDLNLEGGSSVALDKEYTLPSGENVDLTDAKIRLFQWNAGLQPADGLAAIEYAN